MTTLLFLALSLLLLAFPYRAEGAAVPTGHTSPDHKPAGGKALVKNLVTDYGAGVRTNEIADLLQKAVDDVGALGGGTVVIPGRASAWNLARPVLVSYPNVTITGEGGGTQIFGGDVLLILGLKQPSQPPLTPGHAVALGGQAGLLDSSVKEKHFGLRTFAGQTPAAGCFQSSPLAFATKVPHDPSGDYWKDYARGTGKPTYWAHHDRYTINLAVINHSRGLMKGAVCGVGPGGLTPDTTHGTIDDALNIWTIESDPRQGKELRFRFKVVDGAGQETAQSLSLAPEGAGPGLHRMSVQLDFATGRCRAWYSAVGAMDRPPVLTGRLDLPRGCHLKAFEYGALRLGRVVASPFAGSPCQGGADGDWTYAGLSLFDTLRYTLDGGHDRLSDRQTAADLKTPVDDTYRFFPRPGETGLVAFLPLPAEPAHVLVPVQMGPDFGGRIGYGLWLPSRRLEPLGGTIALRDLSLFGGIVVGEAQHVLLEDIYQGGGGYYHGVATLNCGLTEGLLEVRNCRLIGQDAAIYNHGMTIHATNLSGGGGELLFRFVGGRGFVDHVMITGFVAADYYVKLHAGAVGGPWRFAEFCSDNEGFSFVPRKACFYAEPSLDGGPDGNRLLLRGTVYTGGLFATQAVFELADPPNGSDSKASAQLDVDGLDLWAGKDKLDSVVLCRSSRWTGRLRAQGDWVPHTDHGLIHFTGKGPCRVVSVQEADALPNEGAWLADCHLIRIPDKHDAQTGAWNFKTYRCVRSGIYGTGNQPQWQAVKGE